MKHLILAIVALLTACSTNKKEVTKTVQQQETDSILVTYTCGGPQDRPKAKRCEKMAELQVMHIKDNSVLGPFYIDTFIVDRGIIDRIKPLLKKIQPAVDSFYIDTYMYVTIKLKDSIENHICLGIWNERTEFNGEPVILENELVYLLRMYSGYYNWFDEDDLTEYELYFRELSDTSFIRGPIDLSFYRKYRERKDSIMDSIGKKPDKTSKKPRKEKF